MTEENKLKERFVKIDDKVFFESQVKKMTLTELQDLLTDIDFHEREVSAKRKNYKNQYLGKGDVEKFNKNMDNFRTILNSFHEAQKWISSTKRQLNKEVYKDDQINKVFVELARKKLKEKIFIDLMNRAKEMVI